MSTKFVDEIRSLEKEYRQCNCETSIIMHGKCFVCKKPYRDIKEYFKKHQEIILKYFPIIDIPTRTVSKHPHLKKNKEKNNDQIGIF